MLLTVTWPAKRPSTSIANGMPETLAGVPVASAPTRVRNVAGRSLPPGGTVASHGSSHAALRRRTARQARASR